MVHSKKVKGNKTSTARGKENSSLRISSFVFLGAVPWVSLKGAQIEPQRKFRQWDFTLGAGRGGY